MKKILVLVGTLIGAFFISIFVSSGQESDCDLKTGFAQPPAGYGEIPFWWWTGEKLNVDRLIWQLDELKKKGISGVQVNYAHQDVQNEKQPNWLTYPNEPEVFSKEWFDAFEKVAEHCRKLNMGVGLSGYTLDWQKAPNNLFDRIIYCDKETQSRTLRVAEKKRVTPGQSYAEVLETCDLTDRDDDGVVMIVAYPIDVVGLLKADAPVLLDEPQARNVRVNSSYELWIYRAKREPQTLNPLHPDSGRKVVERFFRPFEKRVKTSGESNELGNATLGLDYFFQDELQLGTGETIWFDDVASEFQKRKGYSYWTAAPAMFDANVGDQAEKYRLDYMDLRVKLAEERYFMPIYAWNADCGRIYACDPGSRGKDPYEFCDYFSAVKWYTAPGHDTPGGRADFIKNKVSSSIAHFYQRPRVWLEGYHSFGWGAEPKQLFFATNENFLFGANLLNLHGLYYTTYGGYWEWAPPCYHFRQPYWETFGAFLKYFERLSFALTRGVEQTDFVILYPVTPYQAKLDGERARNVAFCAAEKIYNSGRDVLFIDDDSIARAEVRDGKLCVAGSEHSALVLPSMKGIRWSTLKKALELYRSGGTVVALDALPFASDRAGRNDATLDEIVREIFGVEPRSNKSSIQRNENGGVGAFFSPRIETASNLEENDKIGAEGVISKKRVYPGGFEGRWVWYSEPQKNVYFKWVANGLGSEPCEVDVRFFCDNSGALYVNGVKLCENADYNTGWKGKATLRDGDVVTIDARDNDEPRRGSAGMFVALRNDVKTFATAEDFRCSLVAPTDEWRRAKDGFDALALTDVGNVHVLHRTGVNSEFDANKNASADQNDEYIWNSLDSFVQEYPRDVYDIDSGAGCAVMKRTAENFDLYFIMRANKNARLAFRSQGKVEFLDPMRGIAKEPAYVVCPTEGKNAGYTVTRWPYDRETAGLLVFWKNEKPGLTLTALESNFNEISSLKQGEDGKWRAQGYGEAEVLNVEMTTVDGVKHKLGGKCSTQETITPFESQWDFELLPTLDNRWGDFRLPISEKMIGPEAQRLDFDGVGQCLNDFGRKFWKLGPFPKDSDLNELQNQLAALKEVKPEIPVVWNGKNYFWTPYSFSWRWGIEGAPGREGYHGLKERIDSRFIGLGALKGGFNEDVFKQEDDGSVYFLWSTIPAAITGESPKNGSNPVDVWFSGNAPSAILLDGQNFHENKTWLYCSNDSQTRSSVLLRYDEPGRYACAFLRAKEGNRPSRLIELNGLDNGAFNGLTTGLREETPELVQEPRVPLSTIWFNAPGVLEYDPTPNARDLCSASFIAPPGLKALDVPSYGRIVDLAIEGANVKTTRSERIVPGDAFWQGNREASIDSPARNLDAPLAGTPVYWTRFNLEDTIEQATRVTLAFEPVEGKRDGAFFPEPIRVSCGRGKTTLGDWNNRGILENYSGGAKYSAKFQWNAKEQPKGRVTLELGDAGVSCRVFLNGKQVGDLSTPPWNIDVGQYLIDGENNLEVVVYSALANFYKNIPSRYKNTVPSGLIGPVRIVCDAECEAVEE